MNALKVSWMKTESHFFRRLVAMKRHLSLNGTAPTSHPRVQINCSKDYRWEHILSVLFSPWKQFSLDLFNLILSWLLLVFTWMACADLRAALCAFYACVTLSKCVPDATSMQQCSWQIRGKYHCALVKDKFNHTFTHMHTHIHTVTRTLWRYQGNQNTRANYSYSCRLWDTNSYLGTYTWANTQRSRVIYLQWAVDESMS